MGRQRCESVEDLTGEPCPCYAAWVIHVGNRDYDKLGLELQQLGKQQHACGRHLHSASRALAAAEARTGVKLTIQSI